MYQERFFDKYSEAEKWIESNKNKYQSSILFVENGYIVEYRELRKVY